MVPRNKWGVCGEFGLGWVYCTPFSYISQSQPITLTQTLAFHLLYLD